MKRNLVAFSIMMLMGTLSISFANTPKGSAAKTINKSRTEKRVSIQLYSVRDDIGRDFKGTIAQLAKDGYTSIEAANYGNGKLYGLTPAEFKKAIEATGMKVLSSHAGISLDANIENTNWEEIWKWWDTAIAAHKAAGMTYLVTPSMPHPKTLAELKAYCDYFNKVGEKCNAAGLRFGYHNHSFEFDKIEGKMMYDYMLENTDPTKVFFEMDTYWAVRGGQSPVDYFNKYPGRFLLLHIKDNKEVGQSGMMGFDAIFKNLPKAGTKDLVVEFEQWSDTPLKCAKISVDYLHNNKDLVNFYKTKP